MKVLNYSDNVVGIMDTASIKFAGRFEYAWKIDEFEAEFAPGFQDYSTVIYEPTRSAYHVVTKADENTLLSFNNADEHPATNWMANNIDSVMSSAELAVATEQNLVLVGDVYVPYKDSLSPEDYLSEYKEEKKASINVDRLAAIESGISYNGYEWDSTLVSQSNLTGVVSALQAGIITPASGTGTVIVWRNMDNQDIDMSQEDIFGLSAAMLSRVDTCYKKSWSLKAQVDAATTVSGVDAIVW